MSEKKGKSAIGKIRADSVEHFIADALKSDFFETVLEAHWEKGESNLILVTGENATGKSFLRRIFTACLKKNDIESIALSMEMRAGSLTEPFVRALVFGDEHCMATGNSTAQSITGAMNTSKNRSNRHAIIWDEPDVGLSDSYAMGASTEILEFLEKPPSKLFFALVTTHRKVMLEELRKGKPHHVRLGDKKTLEEVLTGPIEPKRLEHLKERNITLFRKIHKTYDM